MAKKWIQGAIKHPGALRKEMNVKGKKKIPMQRLTGLISRLKKKSKGDKKLSATDLKTLQRAQLAKRLRGFHKAA